MANQDQLAMLSTCIEKHNCREWNRWRRSNRSIPIDLSYTNLQDAYLVLVDFTHANLIGTNFRSADIRGAFLDWSDLTDADLQNTDMRGIRLALANLTGADLKHADLGFANLDYTIVPSADLRFSRLENARLLDLDGVPLWPTVPRSILIALKQEVASLETTSQRLQHLASQWPGYCFRAEIASNPNTPPDTLQFLAPTFPEAFLKNPILSWLFQEERHWIPKEIAENILTAILAQPTLLTQYPHLVNLIEQCI